MFFTDDGVPWDIIAWVALVLIIVMALVLAFKNWRLSVDFAQIVSGYDKLRSEAENKAGVAASRHQLLEAIYEIAGRLLMSDVKNDPSGIETALRKLGECVDSDRVYIMPNIEDDGEQCFILVYDWVADETSRPRWEKNKIFWYPMFGDWRQRLAAGQSININTKEIDPKQMADARDFFYDLKVHSILVLPIHLEGEFWGIAYLANSYRVRYANEDEIKALQSCVCLIVMSILRAQMTKRLISAKEEAQTANEAKSSFLATVSHELRTPLNAVLGLSEIELHNDLPYETRLNIEKIYASGSTLLSIINDILDISKIESGRFEIIPAAYDLPNLISDAIHLNVVRIASKPIKFEPRIDENIPMRLFGDEIRVKQVLNNLLSNAFKYTKEGTVALDVSWEVTGSDCGIIKCVVSDTGSGIKEDDIDQLFSEYVQLDTKANRRIEGSGLGLSICKKLVDMMGGTIEAKSEYGKGSTFTATIPQGISDPMPIGKEIARSLKTFRLMDNRRAKDLVRKPMPYAKVLIVDDVMTNLDVAKGLMRPYGMTIHCASSARLAIDIVREGNIRYDAIFMDHMMPEMDGVEAVSIIREIGSKYAIGVPIIALTANALAGNEEMFLKNGFQAYLSKPIDVLKLDSLLNRYVRDEEMESAHRTSQADKADKNTPSGAVARLSESIRLIDGLDAEAGISRFGDEDAYLRVIRSYAAHTPPLLEKARAPERANLPNYAMTVHGIKGSSFGICAMRVGAMAEELEFYARRGEFETVLTKNSEFVLALEKLLSNLRSVLRETDEAADGPARERETAPDPALLARLLKRCEHYDMSGMDSILSDLEKYDYDSGGELVVWMRSKLDELEYEEIHERLKNTVE